MDSAQPHTDQRDAHSQQHEKQAEPKNCAPLIVLDGERATTQPSLLDSMITGLSDRSG